MSRAWWLRVGAALLSAALTACGGGGGGGSGDSVRISADKTKVSVLGMNGHGVRSDQIGFTLQSGSGTYYAAALSDSEAVTMQVVFTSGTTASVNVDIANVALGTRTSGQLTFLLCRDALCKQEVWREQIPYTATMYQIDTRPLTLSGFEGVVASPVTLNVVPADSDRELVFDTTQASFVTADHAAAGVVTLTASGVGLRRGSHAGTIAIQQRRDGVVRDTAQTIAVSFNVGNGLVAPAVAALPLNASTTAQDLRGQAPVAFAGTLSQPWTARSDSPWLVLDTTEGAGPGALVFHVDAVAAASLLNWRDHTAQVTIASPGLTSVRVPVVLSKRLPDVGLVTPDGVFSGRAQEVRVTGRGLTGLRAADFSVGGLAPTAVAIESDHAAQLTLPALSAGAHPVSISTVLGERGAAALLGVRDVSTIGAATLATTGQKRAAIFDPSRNAVFATVWGSNTLVRYGLNGGRWQANARAVASVGSLVLAPDGSTLYVVSGSRLLEIDPDTLQTRKTHAAPFALDGGNNYGRPLAQTHDLRLWFGGSQWDGIVAFDRATGAFEPAGSGSSSNLSIYSPQLFVPADGSLLLVQSRGIIPELPLVWYGAASGALQVRAGAPAGRSQEVSFSQDGTLMLMEGQRSLYRVSDLELLGQAPVDPDLTPWVSLLSPDGRRIYVVVAPSETGVMHHVEVFDATATDSGTSNFTRLGEIPLPDKAVGCNIYQASDCDARGRWLLDPTGTVLFWVGDTRFVVLPIDSALSGIDATAAASARMLRQAALSGRVRR